MRAALALATAKFISTATPPFMVARHFHPWNVAPTQGPTSTAPATRHVATEVRTDTHLVQMRIRWIQEKITSNKNTAASDEASASAAHGTEWLDDADFVLLQRQIIDHLYSRMF